MPIESIEIEIPDAPIPDLVTWLPLKGKKNDFKTLDWKGNKETLISTHPKNPAILDAMVNMISSAKRRVFLFNWMLQGTLRWPWCFINWPFTAVRRCRGPPCSSLY